MRQVPWFEEANPEEFYPRCYRLSHEEEKAAFIGGYSLQIYEPLHDKNNKMICAPIEDSDQPGHLPSLIRVFAVCMKKAQALASH